jgi:gluconate 5-dehydrogenase
MMNDSSPFSLSGKRALVAGASRGIGLAVAKEVARAGAHTILASRTVEDLEANAEAIRAEGGSAEAVRLDITVPDSIREVLDSVGDVDILHGVSGVNIRKDFRAYSKEEYERIMNTNLHGIAEITRQAGERMIARGRGGKIVLIGSMMSILGLPYLTVYAMTKSGIAGLTRSLAAEWGRYNIQVNCIAPGFIVTDLNRHIWEQPENHEWLKGVQANPSPGQTEDIGPMAVLLSAPGSDFITGQVIAIDGGYSTTAVWPYDPSKE